MCRASEKWRFIVYIMECYSKIFRSKKWIFIYSVICFRKAFICPLYFEHTEKILTYRLTNSSILFSVYATLPHVTHGKVANIPTCICLTYKIRVPYLFYYLSIIYSFVYSRCFPMLYLKKINIMF